MVANADVEAEKMRQIPGIVFADGFAGRRARVARTGVDVFHVIRTYRAVKGDVCRVAEAYDWFTPDQLAAALAYYRAFPEEIDTWLDEEGAMDLEDIRAAIAAASHLVPRGVSRRRG